MRRQRGVSLVEVLLAGALFACLALAAFETLRQIGSGARRLAARHAAYAQLERFTARLRAEARSATAIRITAGAGSGALAGYDDCRELTFFTANARGPAFWAYRWYPNHRADDAVPGDAVVRVTGSAAPCARAAPGDVVLRGLAAGGFTLAQPRLADAPFAVASLMETQAALGVADAAGANVSGGNAVVELAVTTADAMRIVDLAAGVFPGGWTEELVFDCATTTRCDVAHDDARPRRLTRCTLARFSYDAATYPLPAAFAWDGSSGGTSTRRATGWLWSGAFVFHYYDGRTGSADAHDAWVAVANFDGGRFANPAPYAAADPDAARWSAELRPYLSAGSSSAFDAERARCDGVEAAGNANGFLQN